MLLLKSAAPPFLVASCLALVVSAAVYVLSVGPVFAFFAQNGDVPSATICSFYRPLFRAAPSASAAYVNWWGVSDIEAFLLLEDVQYSGD